MHPLTVYKASAGSGKTFTLAVEFIKLLILNPRKYENILAVTFTNKATEEMKHRIVSQLYGLSHGLKSSDSYLKKITTELDVSEDFVRKNADDLTIARMEQEKKHSEELSKQEARIAEKDNEIERLKAMLLNADTEKKLLAISG